MRIKRGLLIIAGISFAAVIGILGMGHRSVYAREDLKKAVQCSFVVSPEFVPGDEKGLFINVNHPMESSTIMYSYYDNGNERALTNREKQELEESGQVQVVDASRDLTSEIYLQTMKEAYLREYGYDVGYEIASFDEISVDGYPGFKIESSYQIRNDEKVHQTVYIIVSKYRTFTVAYQRAEDDDCAELFEESAQSIHLR